MKVLPGDSYPLGATYDGQGTNFSVFSETAEDIELCLFDEEGGETRVTLPEKTAFCRHAYLPGVGPGQHYGFRVHGRFDPAQGLLSCPRKLLLDPYAKAIHGTVEWNPALRPYPLDVENPRPDETDSAPFLPKSVVVDSRFDWQGDTRPGVPLHKTVIYETHVKGLTMRHPEIPEDIRGTFAAVAHPAVIEHFKRLGVNAVELMPVHAFLHDGHLLDRSLRNYWGYNTIGYLAPHREYAAGASPVDCVRSFKEMVRALHREGIEVLLDVVYAHTAEGNHEGPMLSFKGLDNRAYYRLAEDGIHYVDYTGTGNTLNMAHPHVLQLIMDSLRYWITEMHVDGFRFDLAATLARELQDVDMLSSFFSIMHQDPTISTVKLIAEPWDIGEGGYQVGKFPPKWSEWNGKFRDNIRDFWRGGANLGDLADCFAGSSELYEDTGRKPHASINFVTCHDGYSLHDLVSYEQKHNEANGEDNRDGIDDNRSWNCGAEGETDDAGIVALRQQQKRNLLATLFLSQGVPMLLGGDELGRTKRGNNNSYCQDNEINWYPWDAVDRDLLEFTAQLIGLRRRHPVFHRKKWFQGRVSRHSGEEDIAWYKPDGTPMQGEDWDRPESRSLLILLCGMLGYPDEQGNIVRDDDFIVIFNQAPKRVTFMIPEHKEKRDWRKIVDTSLDRVAERGWPVSGQRVRVTARSVVVLRYDR